MLKEIFINPQGPSTNTNLLASPLKSMYILPCLLCGIFLEVVLKAVLVSPFELPHEKIVYWKVPLSVGSSCLWLGLVLIQSFCKQGSCMKPHFLWLFLCRFAGISCFGFLHAEVCVSVESLLVTVFVRAYHLWYWCFPYHVKLKFGKLD